MKSTNTATEVATILYEIGAVIFRPKQPFKFTSGILSPVYSDNRLIISYPKQREKIVDLLIQKLKIVGIPDVIAGTSTAGIPHAAFIAQKLKIPMVYVRSEPKEHGKGNQVEGLIKRGQKVVVVEDLISTAGSSTKVVEALRKMGAKVEDIICIFTYGLKESEENLKKSKVKLHPLTNLETSAKVAVSKKFLKPDQVNVVLDWARDPKNWGHKMGFE
ncbi:MAG: orotate phosphoribosyltransferase [Candidatus Curtissbacteria bacterium]|nr:orotate phosphoribosyltransferase [Candidatus Curtissbacteria bacterium]